MSLHGAKHRGAEEQEHLVVVWCVPRLEEIVTLGAEGPVEMLPAAVDSLEGFLVQQADEPVPARVLLQRLHHELLMVGTDVGLLIDRSHLELVRRHLVVARRDRNAQSVQFQLHGLHEREHALVYVPEVVVVQLLPPWRLGAKQSPAGRH